MYIDHPEVQALSGRSNDRRIVSYGSSPQADIQVTDLSHKNGNSCFSLQISDRVAGGERTIEQLSLPMPGEHNVMNATAAVAVAAADSDSDFRKARRVHRRQAAFHADRRS